MLYIPDRRRGEVVSELFFLAISLFVALLIRVLSVADVRASRSAITVWNLCPGTLPTRFPECLTGTSVSLYCLQRRLFEARV